MKKVLNVLKYIAFLGIGVLVLLYVYPPSEFDKVWDIIKGANFVYVLPVVLVALAAHYSRGLRWKMLVSPLGHEMKGVNAFRAVMIGYFFNTLMPRLGEVSRCVSINRMERLPLPSALGTVVTERIFDLLALGVVVGLTFLLEFDLAGDFILDMVSTKVVSSSGLLSLTNLILLLGLVLAIVLGYLLLKKFGVIKKVADILLSFKEGFTSVFKLKNPWLFIGHTIFIWVAYYAMCYFSFFTLPETANLGPTVGLVVFTLSTIGFLAPVPGGTGTYQYMFVLALSLYAIDEGTAGAVAMIAYVVNTLLNLVVGGLAALSVLLSSNNEKTDAQKAG